MPHNTADTAIDVSQDSEITILDMGGEDTDFGYWNEAWHPDQIQPFYFKIPSERYLTGAIYLFHLNYYVHEPELGLYIGIPEVSWVTNVKVNGSTVGSARNHVEYPDIYGEEGEYSSTFLYTDEVLEVGTNSILINPMEDSEFDIGVNSSARFTLYANSYLEVVPISSLEVSSLTPLTTSVNGGENFSVEVQLKNSGIGSAEITEFSATNASVISAPLETIQGSENENVADNFKVTLAIPQVDETQQKTITLTIEYEDSGTGNVGELIESFPITIHATAATSTPSPGQNLILLAIVAMIIGGMLGSLIVWRLLRKHRKEG